MWVVALRDLWLWNFTNTIGSFSEIICSGRNIFFLLLLTLKHTIWQNALFESFGGKNIDLMALYVT